MKQPIPIFAPQAQKYHAFDRYEYDFEGHTAIVCLPQQDTDETKPFIWRTEFFGVFDQADEEMLRRGYILVHYRIPDLLGCDEAVQKMGRFFAHLVQSWGFCAKTILFGFSRGGLYAVNFAAAFPDHVVALYLDAPVLDLKSWPAGLGMGLGSAKDTELAYPDRSCRHFDGTSHPCGTGCRRKRSRCTIRGKRCATGAQIPRGGCHLHALSQTKLCPSSAQFGRSHTDMRCAGTNDRSKNNINSRLVVHTCTCGRIRNKHQ